MQKPNESDTSLRNFKRGLEVLGHFHVQVSALGDSTNLDLLAAMGPDYFSNRDAREVLQVKRQASWKRLAGLTEAGLIQKRGHSYRIAPFTKELVVALADTLGALVTGLRIAQANPASREALQLALTGLEALYAKGKLSQEDYVRHAKSLQGLISNVVQ